MWISLKGFSGSDGIFYRTTSFRFSKLKIGRYCFGNTIIVSIKKLMENIIESLPYRKLFLFLLNFLSFLWRNTEIVGYWFD